jgi:ubiquinone/menaquinone biosynthesis C-methylase UbiE
MQYTLYITPLSSHQPHKEDKELMSQIQEPGRIHSTFINPDSGAEIARQMSQETWLIQAMGGLFVEKDDLSTVRYLLDIYCGPGSWALEMAFYHPDMDIIAIDSNQHMIEYARAQAKVQGLTNAHFVHMDPIQELDFPDNTFDIINARFIAPFLRTHDWPNLLHECARISKTGSIIRLTETDEPFISTSTASERLKRLSSKALASNGQSFHPLSDDANTCVTPQLNKFLYEIGCENIQEKAHIISYTPNTPGAHLKYDNLKVLYKLSQPFLCAMGVATQPELDRLYEEMITDMLTGNFHALWYFLTCWGYVEK